MRRAVGPPLRSVALLAGVAAAADQVCVVPEPVCCSGSPPEICVP